MKVLITGGNGLVGSRIIELLKDQFEFENISRATGLDIADYQSVKNAVEASKSDIILHLAAKTNVDSCEEDKQHGEEGEAWKVNVLGTKNVAEAAQKYEKKIVYISTDFVFDGEKEYYQEDDTPNPINWYAQTKYEGEKIIQSLATTWTIVRVAYPYRASFEKNDFFRAILSRLKNGQTVPAITDHIFCPTFIDDIASSLKVLFTARGGIYHVVGSSALSPYQAAGIIAEEFGLSNELIQETTREKYFEGKAKRPFRLSLKNDKIVDLGFVPKTFQEGLVIIKNQLQS